MCLFPSNLRPGSDYNVGITVLKASSPINLQASLTSPSGSVISSGTAVANTAGNLQSYFFISLINFVFA